MNKINKFLFSVFLVALTFVTNAADLVIAEKGKSDYQIVLPDKFPDAAVDTWINSTAVLFQTAFKANGFNLPIIGESKKDPSKPCIYIGNTMFARKNGIDSSKFNDWTYIQKTVGKDLIISGNDKVDKNDKKNTPPVCLLGTAKGVSDFLYQYAGARFLYPSYKISKTRQNMDNTNGIDPRGIEFMKIEKIAVPSDLNVEKTPELLANYDFQRETFYHIAQNSFPMIGDRLHQHTYTLAVPAAKYKETHPEYFALIGGKRACDIKSGKKNEWLEQYCISNPEVQELIYKYMLDDLDQGKEITSLGQPDGFRPCECEACKKLYNTGDDWGEKIWIFHRNLAQRLMKDRPGKKVAMLCYQRTGSAPKTFTKFPESAMLYILGDSTDEKLAEWKKLEVPGGFIAYIHTWGGYHQAGPYAPVRTPEYIGRLVKKLHDCNVRIILKDGSMGFCWGLEGPAYYVYGRMFDDVDKNNNVKDILEEFYAAAFGKAAPAMKKFYERLYKQIEIYSETLGTHCPAWIQTRHHGNFSLIAFLYSPDFMIAADADLKQAEKLADSDRVKARISLVRTELEYLKGLAKIIHLYQAYQLQQDKASLNALLDSIDKWHSWINALYDENGKMKPISGWPEMYPFSGHPHTNVALEGNSYQNFYKDTCLNWDTKAMRNMVFSNSKELLVKRVSETLKIDSAIWNTADGQIMVNMKNGTAPSKDKTIIKVLYDKENLYLRVDVDGFDKVTSNIKKVPADGEFENADCIDFSISPFAEKEKFYHFIVGLSPDSKYDAAHGFITDPIDPRCGKDDIAWNGEWEYSGRIDQNAKRWTVMLKIPFKTLGSTVPEPGSSWALNAGFRKIVKGNPEESVCFFTAGMTELSDSNAFGNMLFEK